MSVTISSGVSPGASAIGGAIPRLRSRSVSLRIGSFGLTYATDQVVWSAAAPQSVAEKAAGPDPAAGPVEAASPAGDATTAVSPQVAAQQPAQQTAQPQRPFVDELNDARVREQLLRQARQAAPAAKAETRQAEGGDSAAPGQEQSGSSAKFSSGCGGALRRAIGAYLACAARLSRPEPMLRAVA